MNANAATSTKSGPRQRASSPATIALSMLFPALLLPATAAAENHIVTARPDLTFSPRTLAIVAGDTVTFRNGGGFHNVVSDPGAVTAFRCANGCDGAGGNGNLSSSLWSATVTFPTPGTIGYFCEAHGARGGVGMAGTITVISASPTARHHDFDGDGESDILWRNTSTGANALWLSASFAQARNLAPAGLDWRVVGAGDYDGDGASDILWRNLRSGANALWLSADAGRSRAVTAVTNLAWTVAGSGDYDGDGESDILWRNTTTGANAVWFSASFAQGRNLAPARLDWRVVGSGDYNGDGVSDILWRHIRSGANALWLSADAGRPQAVTGVPNLAWTVAGSGDYDGDGESDILWRNTSTGANAIWFSARSAQARNLAPARLDWRVAGSGDYNGDGASDILWRNIRTGGNAIWLSADVGRSQSVTGVTNQAWSIQDPR